MKYSKSGITMISLIVTIIVLLILAGVTIALLSGENGILSKANTAKERTEFAAAEEKVILATLASYDEQGSIENSMLKNNLDKIEGIENIKTTTGTAITEEITDEDYPLTVTVNNYEFTIEKEGTVVASDTTDDSNNNEDSSSSIDTSELIARVNALETKVQTLETNYNTQSEALTNLSNSFTTLSNKLSPTEFIKPTLVDGVSIVSGGYAKVGNIVIVNMTFGVNTSKLPISTNPNTGYATMSFTDFPKSLNTSATLYAQYWTSGFGATPMTARVTNTGEFYIAMSPQNTYTSGYGISVQGTYIAAE